jgi:peptidoglycan/xylan/chitin deacetylase (PgdA/CDA1 family)
MRIPALLFFASLSLITFSQKKQVCFSFDDLPVVTYRIKDQDAQKRLNAKLISSLNKYRIPAIGFVNEKKLNDSTGLIKYQVDLLKAWVAGGLDLGNHTFSHPDYNNVSLKQFSEDLLKGETVTRAILSGKNMKLKYFRHPFLHVGNTKEKADSLSNFLSEHGYTVAPVTIDNEDYLFAVAYERSKFKNDTVMMKQIGHDFVDYIEKKLKYFEEESDKLFGRNISQILLLHASYLNSDYVDALAVMFLKNNYTFVSMDKALEDTAYKTEITRFGNWGITWLDRWALSMGKKGDFFKDEPATPEYIVKMSK